ncbi:hypothetical protein [Streptomyces sp. NPDC088757]|uniref:hypothetical protein n=1 Tax=Streptomyces sp. NPDC088757 TaxID=3365889 RepID=UPI0037F39CE7
MSTETPEQILAAADTAIEEADAELQGLEQRVIADDADVTPEQIEQARSRRYFAGLRRQAAEKRAATERQRLAAEAERATLTEVQQLLDAAPKSVVDEKLAAAQRAVAELRDAIDAYNDGAQAAWQVFARTKAVPMTAYDPLMPMHHQIRPGLGWGYVHGSQALWLDGQNIISLDRAGIVKRVTEEG